MNATDSDNISKQGKTPKTEVRNTFLIASKDNKVPSRNSHLLLRRGMWHFVSGAHRAPLWDKARAAFCSPKNSHHAQSSYTLILVYYYGTQIFIWLKHFFRCTQEKIIFIELSNRRRQLSTMHLQATNPKDHPRKIYHNRKLLYEC